MSEANRQTQSKDPVPAGTTTGNAGNFRVEVRFFEEPEGEMRPVASRKAAIECSPRRKPWVDSRK